MAPKIRGVFEKVPGSGVWWIQYFHPLGSYDCGRPGCRGRHRERVGTKSNADKLYKKRKTQILTGEKLPELQRKRVTLGELIDLAVAYSRENHNHARDTENKAGLVRKDLGHFPAESVTPSMIEGWIARRGVATATQNRYKAFFSLCFREGVHRELVSVNPARQVRRKRESEGRKRFLSIDEYHRLLAECPTPARAQQVTFSVMTGVRKGEQDRLEWRDVDLDREEITLRNTKNRTDRTVPMATEVRDILLQLAAERPKRTRKDRVFPRPRGGVTEIQTAWFEAALDRAKIDDYTWHNNRHTFCSWYMMAGGEILELKKIAGHKSYAMTARYAHLSPNQMKSGMARLGRMLENGKARILAFPSATKTASQT